MANLLVSVILLICLYLQIGQSEVLEIVGGTPVNADNYPFMAWFSVGCGGSILRKERPAAILTAAHCVDGITLGENTYVLLHADNINDPDGLKFQVDSYKVHPDYDGSGSEGSDVALLFIDADLTNNALLSTVTINENSVSSPSLTECCNTGDDLTVIGYGRDCEGCDLTPTLESVDVDYLSRSSCSNGEPGRYQVGEIDDTMICAYTVDADSCQGDSGGPLIKKGTNEQVGIVSWGIGCARYPGVYANIGDPNIYKWIKDNTASPSPVASFVEIKNVESTECIDIADGSEGHVITWPCHGGDNQQWILGTPDSDGYYIIQSLWGDKECMDVNLGPDQTANNDDNVITWPCHNGDNQKWKIEGNLIRSKLGDFCLDDTDGSNVIIYQCESNNNNQIFAVNAISEDNDRFGIPKLVLYFL